MKYVKFYFSSDYPRGKRRLEIAIMIMIFVAFSNTFFGWF